MSILQMMQNDIVDSAAEELYTFESKQPKNCTVWSALLYESQLAFMRAVLRELPYYVFSPTELEAIHRHAQYLHICWDIWFQTKQDIAAVMKMAATVIWEASNGLS